MKTVFCIILAFLTFSAFSQEDDKNDIFNRLEKSGPGYGKVTINQDYSAKNLIRKHAEVNKDLMPEGYRIVIYSGSGAGNETKANSERGRFKALHPSHGAYIEYFEPNFKVHVGDFRNKSDALKLYEDLIEEFPGSYIITDRIEFPKL
ncbi:MAG: hypothetical protein A2W91_06480 [Bacteroidetes bacterium GWF2_38_335]|nr:MAG: hypothetical protein A2W91_06480 [Bacteroidetes bacterium GWF2_38_335]OFY77679.1 MAG: hypothetical protein A2281_17995 [Bacteroidetes bacterium RIFOXYA12_FULL_38_20]HBS89092.1 hypothetical protein [Bacteroidales bacterium]